ncbi:MAG: hypothetical protein JXR70_16500 [Spirochaetales bacterium]|nr:hypothetical protein [Spirochaetales bacterium]
MKLNTESIKNKALEVYKAALSDPGIDDEITSEIYELFILRMTSYMNRHEQTVEVSSGFINQAVKFIIRDIRKGKKRAASRESSLELLHQGLDEEKNYIHQTVEITPAEDKLLRFLKTQLKSKKSFQQQARYFILFYTCYFSSSFLTLSAELLNISLFEWEHTNRLIREKALNNHEQKMKKTRTALNKCYYKLLEYQNKMNKSLNIQDKIICQNTCLFWEEKQSRLLKKQKEIQITPTLRQMAEATGCHENTISYNIKAFTELLQHPNTSTKLKQYKQAV